MAPVFLPFETIQRIIYFLTHGWAIPHNRYLEEWTLLPDISEYAAVSRFWQHVIERETFAELHLDSDRLLELNSIVTPQRRGYVRTIQFNIDLPWPGGRYKPQSDREKLRNNVALQAAFEAFLQTLSQWDAAEVYKNGVKLSLKAPIPVERRPDCPMEGPRAARWKRRYAESVLELTDPERIAQLPPVMAITSFETINPADFERYISAVAVGVLLAKLPAVKHVVIDWWKALRFLRLRNDLADALSQIKHPIDRFILCDPDFLSLNQAHPFPIPGTVRQGEDGLSKSIHVLSQRVKKLDIYHIAVSDEIFFPQTLSVGMAEPRWERLVTFNLYYPPVSPSGELLFLPDPYARQRSESVASSSSSAPGDTEIDPPPNTLSIATPAMQQFYLAAARAALQMPALRDMTLAAELGSDEYWHEFWYHVNGASAKALWTSNSGFTPEDDVLECWRKVPKKHLETELEVELLQVDLRL